MWLVLLTGERGKMSSLSTLKGQNRLLLFSGFTSNAAESALKKEIQTGAGQMKTWVAGTTAQKCLNTILQGQGAQTRWAREICKAFAVSSLPFLVVLVTLSSSFKNSSQKRCLQHLLPKNDPQDLLSKLIWCRGRTDPDA